MIELKLVVELANEEEEKALLQTNETQDSKPIQNQVTVETVISETSQANNEVQLSAQDVSDTEKNT